MKNNKTRGSDGMAAYAWEMFSTKYKRVDVLIELKIIMETRAVTSE
jgi:hypothetical protein